MSQTFNQSMKISEQFDHETKHRLAIKERELLVKE
jgi:hypothetical protein